MKPNLFILYVEDVAQTERFYSELFETAAVESSDTFTLFNFADSWQLGLWSKHTVMPASQASSQCMELGIRLDSVEAVNHCYDKLRTQNVAVVQPPKQLDFGYALTALDPDSHRLRFYHLGA